MTDLSELEISLMLNVQEAAIILAALEDFAVAVPLCKETVDELDRRILLAWTTAGRQSVARQTMKASRSGKAAKKRKVVTLEHKRL